jgi:hypothetical protein
MIIFGGSDGQSYYNDVFEFQFEESNYISNMKKKMFNCFKECNFTDIDLFYHQTSSNDDEENEFNFLNDLKKKSEPAIFLDLKNKNSTSSPASSTSTSKIYFN